MKNDPSMRHKWVLAASLLLAFAAGAGLTLVIAYFPDVPPDHFAYDDINWALENGITTGFPDGTFRPEEYVTRAQMAAFMHRLAGMLVAAGVHVVKDPFGNPAIDRWFNNVNGVTPILAKTTDGYAIDVGFDVSKRYPLATIEGKSVGLRFPIIAASVPGTGGNQTVDIRIRNDSGLPVPADFFLLIY